MFETRTTVEPVIPSAGRHVILGAGPVGQALVDTLAGQGVRPTVVTRSGAGCQGADAVAADLTDPAAAETALRDAAVVYQCAQPAYHRWPEEFPGLQRSIVAAARQCGVSVLVAVENMYGYGQVSGPIHEGLPLCSSGRKGAVRAAMWNELREAHESGALNVVAARASDFYGPRVTASAFGERFFEPLIAGKKPSVLGDPARLHTVTYVPDLAQAMVQLGTAPDAWGKAWHVPNAPTVSTAELVAVAAAAAATGSTRRARVTPAWQLRVAGRFSPAIRELVELLYEFDEDFVVDDSRFTTRFAGSATSLPDGLRATVAWYRARAS